MATKKCKICGRYLLVTGVATTVTCQFCGTTQSVLDEESKDDQTVEALQVEKRYEQLVQKARKYRDIKVLRETADEFYRLGTYKESLQMAEFCIARANEEEQRQIEQAKLQEAEELLRKKEQKKYRIKMAIIYTIAAALLIAFIIIMSQAEIKTYGVGLM